MRSLALALLVLAVALAPAASASEPAVLAVGPTDCPAQLPACVHEHEGIIYVCVDTPGIVRCDPITL